MSFLNKVTVEDLDVKGRRVLVRVDFNVPLKDGKVTNDNRIVGAIPTIRYLADHGAKVILCSHLGKPKGPDAAFTMAPVAARLGELMGRPVLFADDDTVVGENARRMVSEMKDGDILVLQNTRFRPEETKNLPEFSKELASLADVYVDDAFGSAGSQHEILQALDDLIGVFQQGTVVRRDEGFTFDTVQEDRVDGAVAFLGRSILHRRREGGAAHAGDPFFPQDLTDQIRGNVSFAAGFDILAHGILAIILDDHALGNHAVGHIPIFQFHDHAAYAGVDIGADEAACFTNHLPDRDLIPWFDHRFCRSTNVLGKRNVHHVRGRASFDGHFVGQGLAGGYFYTAHETCFLCRHSVHL